MSGPVPFSVAGLSIDFMTASGRINAVRNVDLAFGSAEIRRLIGESGSGKSTVALALQGLSAANARVASGRLRMGGMDYPIEGGLTASRGRDIAKALLARPKLLIADEPTTALDVTVEAQVMDQLCALRDEIGCAILLISHNLAVVRLVADQVAVMQAGRIVKIGPAGEVLQSPRSDYTKLLLQSWPKARRAIA